MSQPFNDRGPFKVGEICRIVNCTSMPDVNGSEVSIESGAFIGVGTDNRIKACYEVKFSFGHRAVVAEEVLRRKRPPSTGEDQVMGLFNKTPVRVLEPV